MSIRFVVLTISDRSARGERADASGPALVDAIRNQGWVVTGAETLPDDQAQIEHSLMKWCDSGQTDVILTTGGTGFAPRDVTPEATLAVIQRPTPGLTEAMRLDSLKVTPHAMLSRAAAGIRGQTLIVNLPGSPKGALENLRTLLPVLAHAIELLQGSPNAESGHQATKG